jgi:DNA polymerase V
MSLYVQDAVSRLRGERLLCGYMIGFVQSNPFDTHKPYYSESAALTLPEPTDNVLTLCKIATEIIDDLYQKDIGFKKCGVILTCLEPKAKHTYDLVTDMKQVGLDNSLMDSLEQIHGRFGKTKLALGASMLPNRTWNMSRNQLTQNYFKWDQLLCVK